MIGRFRLLPEGLAVTSRGLAKGCGAPPSHPAGTVVKLDLIAS